MSFFNQGGPQGTVNPSGGVQQTRRNSQTGRTQILVYDERSRGMIWVDALWNPVIDRMVPIDPRYRGDIDQALYVPQGNIFGRFNFAGDGSGVDFSGPLDLPLPDDGSGSIQLSSLTRPASSDNGTVLLLAGGALIVIYLMSR